MMSAELVSIDLHNSNLVEGTLALALSVSSLVEVSQTFRLDYALIESLKNVEDADIDYVGLWDMCHQAIGADGRYEIHMTDDGEYLWITESGE